MPTIINDSKYVGYIHERSSPLIVTFQDLETLKEKSLVIPELNGASGGRLLWSPDNSKAIFTAESKTVQYFLVLVNREDLTYSMFTNGDYGVIYANKWIGNDEVVFYDPQSTNKYYLLNIESGEYIEYDPESSSDE